VSSVFYLHHYYIRNDLALPGYGSYLFLSPFVSTSLSILTIFILGRNCGISKTIETVELINWSWKKAQTKLFNSLLFFIIILWLITILIGRLIGGTIGGISFGITWILIFLLMSGLNISEIKIKVIPNQGIVKSGTNAAFFGICSLLISLLVVGLSAGQTAGWDIAITFSPSIMLIFCFSGGAKSLIQHFILRFILYCNGYIPWNYARFLDYCTERLFLQRVGGRYRFIHKLLQDHFAQMEFKRN